MNRKELEYFLGYDRKNENNRMFVPNEIFNDFAKIDGDVSSKAFCYSFYYLIIYLYRFAKYGDKYFSVQDIKTILGYSATNKTMDKYIKRNGVLNKMGYLEQTTDIPLSFYFEDMGVSKNGKRLKSIEFNYYKEKGNKPVKFPVKAFYRTEERDNYDGVFFSVDNTTMIPVDTFLFCMTNKNLSVEGFWLYSYIKFKNDYFGGSWDIARNKMAKEIGIGETTLNRLLVELEKYNMISNSHTPYVLGKPQHYKIDACSYNVVDSYFFRDNEEEISKRDVMSFKSWCEINGIDYDQAMDGESYSQEENPFL